VTYPKIELHVHLEGSVRPRTLLEIARRNDLPLPADSEEGLAKLYRFRDFRHFLEVWLMTTAVLRREADFRQVVVEYAREAAEHGAVYIEGIFAPAEPVARGAAWDEVFTGYCDGAQQAYEETGVEVRLTTDISRGVPLEVADLTVEHAARYRDRGVLGVGLGGPEAEFPPELYERPFAAARSAGLAPVPHAGEAAGAASVWGALETLGAERIRHGIRAAEDPVLVSELAARGIVLDVCLISNLVTRSVASLGVHPLRDLVAAGVSCSLSTDDPAMFDTDLTKEYEAAASLGVDPERLYWAGLRGALCDEGTRQRLAEVGRTADWTGAHPPGPPGRAVS
jgi:aminodeoxyfutalosine deaminase